MKKITAFILSLVVACGCFTITAQAAEKEVTENISITKAEYESYTPEKEKKIDGKKYKLKDVKNVGETNSTFVVTTEHLQNDNYEAPNSAVNPENDKQTGVLYDFHIEKTPVTERSAVVSKSVGYTAVPLDYIIPDSYTTDYTDTDTGLKITAALKLKSSKTDKQYWHSVNDLTGSVTGYDALYYTLKNSNTEIPKNEVAPVYQGYEKAILNSLNLSPDNYRITGAQWQGEAYTSGNTVCRNCTYTVEALVCDISAVYESEITLPDKIEYTATATYLNNKDSKVNLVLTYEKDNTAVTIIASTAIGLVILALLIAVILFYISKRKNGEIKNKEVGMNGTDSSKLL